VGIEKVIFSVTENYSDIFSIFLAMDYFAFIMFNIDIQSKTIDRE